MYKYWTTIFKRLHTRMAHEPTYAIIDPPATVGKRNGTGKQFRGHI